MARSCDELTARLRTGAVCASVADSGTAPESGEDLDIIRQLHLCPRLLATCTASDVSEK